MNVGEFFVSLGFNADTVKVKDFAQAVSSLPIDIAASIVALAGIDYELLKVTEQAMDASVAFDHFANQTGLSWQELQRWQIVAAQANVSADAVASSVTAISRQLAEIRLGRGNIAPFQILGIGTNQNAFQVLDQLRQRIKGLEPSMATNLLSQMGIDPAMINVLRLSNAEFAKLSHTVAGMSGNQEGSFLRAKESLVQFGLVAKYLGFDVAANLVWAFENLYKVLSKFKIVMAGVAVVLAGLAAYFFPITAAILALILVLDDLSTYFQGGDSLFGLAIKGIKELVQELDPFAGKLGALGKIAGFGASLAALGPVGIGQQAVGAISRVVNQSVNVQVHSTAPAHDVAKEVKAHIDRAASQASLQTNQQGY